MAKSDRHKKLRRKEKAKTQLTGVRKLARAQNIVEPTFRAKKILIREQLQSPGEGDVVQGSRNRSLQDILQSLNHHNTNIKRDAINGLKEILSSTPEAIYANLDKILEKVGSLTSDVESTVRKENLELTENIFALLSEDQIKPFWNLLLTYIKCTLTNLSAGIRQSCLPFISLLLSYFPNLVSTSLHVLLPSVLGLISSVGRTSSAPVAVGKKSAPGNTLKLEISAKHESSKERIKVLKFLASCLDLRHQFAEQGGADRSSKIPSLVCLQEDPAIHAGIYYPFGYAECRGEPFYYGFHGSFIKEAFLNNSSTTSIPKYFNSELSSASGDASTDTEFWPSFIESCLPLLHQTWIEVRPSLKDGKADSQGRQHLKITGKEDASRGLCNLPSSAVEVLDCIVSVMSRLVLGNLGVNSESWSSNTAEESSNLRRLRKNHGQDLRKYFFQWLPFSAVQESQRSVLTLLNLQLFHIAAQLRLVDADIMQQLKHYLQVLMKKSALDSMQIRTILEILPLIHIGGVSELTNEILIYAVSSGYSESVHNFLLGNLEIGQRKSGGLRLESIYWDQIVPILLQESLNSSLLRILTFIAIRNLMDLSSLLRVHKEGLKKCKNEGGSDEVLRLLTYANCLCLFQEEVGMIACREELVEK